jgi:deoxycytidylate deaminase
MKTENYLNLCLEQAAKSSLRYRHGAIIVRGGKVIGKGYNDHRSGFDGGALKTGRLPLRSMQGPVVADLKKNHKLERESCEPENLSNKTFTPFESMGGGGQLANTPLSMHSEMMAIHSALSASSTLAASAVSSEKPCFKLSGGSKPKSRLRKEAVKSYVKAVCEAALAQSTATSCHAQSGVQEWRFDYSAPGSQETESSVSRQGEERERGLARNEQYGETPYEERKEPSTSQCWQQVQRWTTQTKWSTASA